MTAPVFLDMDLVIRTHRSLIEAYGGIDGIRDAGLLHSAIAMPQASFGGQYAAPVMGRRWSDLCQHVVHGRWNYVATRPTGRV